jgi:hypothetical protein
MLIKEPLVGLWLFWILGGVLAIFLVAHQEKKRLKGRLFSHIIDDIRELPFAATLGYVFIFICSWLSVCNKTIK